MGVGWGMAKAWLGVMREGYKARQTMAHLNKNRWNYMGKQLYKHQKGRSLNQTKRRRQRNQQGSGFPLVMLASWGINKIRKKIQEGTGKKAKDSHTLY